MTLVSHMLAYVVEESFSLLLGPLIPPFEYSLWKAVTRMKEEKGRFISRRHEFTFRHNIQPAVTIYQLTYLAGHLVGKQPKYKELAV